VGLSDHTFTNYATFAAVSMGATVIEKHFVLSRRMYGSDAAHSLEPKEFEDLVRGVRAIETMMSSPVDKDDLSAVAGMKTIFEKSIVTLNAVPKGGLFTEANVGCRKPGGGLAPSRLKELVGKKARRALPAGWVIRDKDVRWGRR
jgi:N,N'-diacetyllegionaminate synthase